MPILRSFFRPQFLFQFRGAAQACRHDRGLAHLRRVYGDTLPRGEFADFPTVVFARLPKVDLLAFDFVEPLAAQMSVGRRQPFVSHRER